MCIKHPELLCLSNHCSLKLLADRIYPLFFSSLNIICRFPIYNPTKSVGAQLIRKYEQQFSFYQVKPINQILNGYYDRKTFIDLCDIRIYSEDAQFLRRVYYYYTLTGRQQIDHRLRMCGQYYANNRVMNYQYPMMVVTKTKSLFMRRERRLKKIQAGEGSSDESAEQDKQKMLFQPSSYYILGDIDRDSLDEQSAEADQDLQYDSQEHDVFQEAQHQLQPPKLTKKHLSNIQEQQLSHLIQDMSKKSQQKTGQGLSYNSANINLTQIKVQPIKDNSISITSVEESALKSLNNREKPRFYEYLAQPMFQEILNLSKLSQKLSNPIAKSYTSKKLSQNQDKQREQRRMKIRSKAEQLLKAVRSRQQAKLPQSS